MNKKVELHVVFGMEHTVADCADDGVLDMVMKSYESSTVEDSVELSRALSDAFGWD